MLVVLIVHLLFVCMLETAHMRVEPRQKAQINKEQENALHIYESREILKEKA